MSEIDWNGSATLISAEQLSFRTLSDLDIKYYIQKQSYGCTAFDGSTDVSYHSDLCASHSPFLVQTGACKNLERIAATYQKQG